MKYLNPRKKLVEQIRDIAAELSSYGLDQWEVRLLSICHELLKEKEKKCNHNWIVAGDVTHYYVCSKCNKPKEEKKEECQCYVFMGNKFIDLTAYSHREDCPLIETEDDCTAGPYCKCEDCRNYEGDLPIDRV